MKPTRLAVVSGLIVLSGVSLRPVETAQAHKPNIFLILTDDQGYDGPGFFPGDKSSRRGAGHRCHRPAHRPGRWVGGSNARDYR